MNLLAIRNSEVLEILRNAEQRIVNPDIEWVFSDWSSCTCGHIYTAAMGTVGSSDVVFDEIDDETVYGQAIIAVATSLGWRYEDETYHDPTIGRRGYGPYEYDNMAKAAAGFVSDYTYAAAGGRAHMNPSGSESTSNIEREDALRVVRGAIASIEMQEDKDRVAFIEKATVGIIPDA